MAGHANLDRLFDILDPNLGVQIVIFNRSRLGMLERRFGMGDKLIRMALFATIDRFVEVADRLRQMSLGRGKRWQKEGRRTKPQSEKERFSIHDLASPCPASMIGSRGDGGWPHFLFSVKRGGGRSRSYAQPMKGEY